MENLKEILKKDNFSFTDIGFANVDTGRKSRCGSPEVIYCKGKNNKELKKIAQQMTNCSPFIATKVSSSQSKIFKDIFPKGIYKQRGQIFTANRTSDKLKGNILILTAGTTDLPIAEEALATAEAYGADVSVKSDVGVAGVHRLLARRDEILKSTVIIVVAGMEGALPSVVSGLVSQPVIAVPTSVGYGASFEGLAALLAMLNTCAPGVAVMNIDNGFGAGYFAASILKTKV